MTAPAVVASPGRAAPRLDPARLRAWLAAAIVALLVLVYLTAEYTYSSSHLPPPRYRPTAPGGIGHGKSADFRVTAIRRTDAWGTDLDGNAGTPEAGAVWVVADVEVTPKVHDDFLLCTLTLVSTDRRAWPSEDLGPSHKGESCAPDPEHVTLGTTYPFVVGFQVPEAEADHVAGLGLEVYSGRAQPLLRPPG